jgi:hypothetical protein
MAVDPQGRPVSYQPAPAQYAYVPPPPLDSLKVPYEDESQKVQYFNVQTQEMVSSTSPLDRQVPDQPDPNFRLSQLRLPSPSSSSKELLPDKEENREISLVQTSIVNLETSVEEIEPTAPMEEERTQEDHLIPSLSLPTFEIKAEGLGSVLEKQELSEGLEPEDDVPPPPPSKDDVVRPPVSPVSANKLKGGRALPENLRYSQALNDSSSPSK